MEFVKDLPDILDNIRTFDEYLKDPAKQDFAIDLIKGGTCFVAVKKEQGYDFYPSRFVGYKDNSYDTYTRYKMEEGKDTVPVISQILKHKPDPTQDMEEEYKKFCLKLGFTAKNSGEAGEEHKYWITGIQE